MGVNLKVLTTKDEAKYVPGKIASFRQRAIDKAIARAIQMKVIGSRDEAAVRPFQNILDAGTAADQWRTAALAAVGTAYSCFQAIAAPTLANNRLAVFYGVGVEEVPFPVGLLTIRVGGAAGNILAEFDLEQLANCETPEGYFSEPIVIDPSKQFAIQAMARIATGLFTRVQLMAFVVEPDTNRIVSQR